MQISLKYIKEIPLKLQKVVLIRFVGVSIYKLTKIKVNK